MVLISQWNRNFISTSLFRYRLPREGARRRLYLACCTRSRSIVRRRTKMRPIVRTSSSIPPPDSSEKDHSHEKTWVDLYLPVSAQPYAYLSRIDKPIGTWLLLWPCWWSTALASQSLPDVSLLTWFAVGSLTMRSAGCIINDLWDQQIDRRVARTRKRPLASGVLSQRQALWFLLAHGFVGLGVLTSLPHMLYCIKWGLASVPLVIFYPTTKRFFPFPQLVLGLTFNWGAWMGWAATHGSIDFSIVAPLYFSGVTWTLLYDTIYAHQDKKDDAKLGLHSTALTFGEDPMRQRAILNCLALATFSQWCIVGIQADLASIYYVGIGTGLCHLLWQIRTADFDNPENLAERFRSNSKVGAILFASIAAGRYFS